VNAITTPKRAPALEMKYRMRIEEIGRRLASTVMKVERSAWRWASG
jgi:hypothetical protein